MSKYISLYNSSADYALDASTMEFPHVSLIEGTGELKYISFKLKKLYDAPFGAIVVEDVANDRLTYIPQGDYNQTDYPTNSYKPFAVCIYDAASRNDNQAVFWVLPDRIPSRIRMGANTLSRSDLEFLDNVFDTNEELAYLSGDYTTIEKNNYFRESCNVDIDISFEDDLSTDTIEGNIAQYYFSSSEPYPMISFVKNLKSRYINKGSFYVPTSSDFEKVVNNDFFSSNYIFSTGNLFAGQTKRFLLNKTPNYNIPRLLVIGSNNTITIENYSYWHGKSFPSPIFYAGPEFN